MVFDESHRRHSQVWLLYHRRLRRLRVPELQARSQTELRLGSAEWLRVQPRLFESQGEYWMPQPKPGPLRFVRFVRQRSMQPIVGSLAERAPDLAWERLQRARKP